MTVMLTTDQTVFDLRNQIDSSENFDMNERTCRTTKGRRPAVLSIGTTYLTSPGTANSRNFS